MIVKTEGILEALALLLREWLCQVLFDECTHANRIVYRILSKDLHNGIQYLESRAKLVQIQGLGLVGRHHWNPNFFSFYVLTKRFSMKFSGHSLTSGGCGLRRQRGSSDTYPPGISQKRQLHLRTQHNWSSSEAQCSHTYHDTGEEWRHEGLTRADRPRFSSGPPQSRQLTPTHRPTPVKERW